MPSFYTSSVCKRKILFPQRHFTLFEAMIVAYKTATIDAFQRLSVARVKQLDSIIRFQDILGLLYISENIIDRKLCAQRS